MPRAGVAQLNMLPESRSSYSPFSPDSRASQQQNPGGVASSYSRLTINSLPGSNACSPSSYRTRSIAYKAVEEEKYQRLASHIWGGQVSHDSYMQMLGRVREQFRNPQVHGHEPLIFPPVIPSASRPNEPEVPRFSRGIRLLRDGLVNYTGTAAATGRPSLSQEVPAASTSGTSGGAMIGSAAALPPLENTTASLPIFELDTDDHKLERLYQLETLERRRLEATEKWGRNVVNEMMVVHYVTYVLKPEMEEVQARERFVRGMIRYEEEKAFYYLYNESPLAQKIHTETRALREKEAKLSRLRDLEADFQDKRMPASSKSFNAFRPFPTSTSGRGNPGMKDVVQIDASKLKDQGDDAREILQKYVRQKHGKEIAESAPTPAAAEALLNTNATAANARRVSSLPLPPISSVPRRNTLGVADYITLLDEDDQYRALIEIAERDERRDITRMMRDDRNAVMDWQRKHMHLQRLMYWRNEREENLKKELERVTRTLGISWSEEALQQLDEMNKEEQRLRQSIEAAQEDKLGKMLSKSKFFSDCYYQRQLMREEEKARRAIDVMRATELVNNSVAEEASMREVHTLLHEKFIAGIVEPRREVLRLLYGVSIKPRKFRALLAIQRAYYKHKHGLIGHKRTHKKIGQDIQAMRNAAMLARGLGVFNGYKNQIQSEIDAIDNAAREKFLQGAQKLTAGEFQERMILESNEAMQYNNIKRTFVKSMREDVIGGFITRMFREELEKRAEREVAEQLHFSAILTFCNTLSRLIAAKEKTAVEETRGRQALDDEETEAYRALMGDEYDRREEIRIDAEEEAARLRKERLEHGIQLEGERAEVEAAMLQDHFLFINRLEQRGVTKHAFELRFYNEAFADSTHELVSDWSEWALQCHAVLGWVDVINHQQLIHVREVELHEENEKITRREAEKLEDTLFYEIQKAYTKMLEETQEKLDDEQRAVRLLCQTWRKYKANDLGRTATRKFLHEAFRPKRERLEIQRRNAANLRHINGVKAQLEEEEEKHMKETVDSIWVKMSVLVSKTEPRARWEITDKEDMIFTIMRNNFCSAGIRAFDPRNTMALLWQQESYERVMIKKEWKRAFEVNFGPRKAVFKEDVMIRPIQRAWRAYSRRCKLAKVHAVEREVLERAELSDRFYIMEREAVIYRDLYHEVMELEWRAGLLFTLSSDNVEAMASAAFASLVRQEWNERAGLLWEMRYDLCDGCLAASEARARRFLISEEFIPGKQHAEFFGEETLKRGLLMQERNFFLLRVLCKQERAHRDTIVAEAEQGTAERWLEMDEELARNTCIDDYCRFWDTAIYEPLARLTAIELAKEEAAARVWADLYAEEGATRCEVEAEEVSARQRQLHLMERMGRGLLHTNEQFERQGIILISWSEEKERREIISSWAQGIHYGPSSFAPDLVYQRMPVYVRCIEEAEALVRQYLENSEHAAAEFLRTNVEYLKQEFDSRRGLKAEEKIVREQRVILLEEQQQRSDIIGEWARGVEYVPSSFAPHIVKQRINVFLGAVEQTESISRDYLLLSEDIAFRSMRREKMYLDYEKNERAALQQLEEQEIKTRTLMLREESSRQKIERDFQTGLFYAPSSFAPTMVNEEIPLYIRCITEAEELVRRNVEHQELDMRLFFKREMWQKGEYVKEMDAFDRGLREQRAAVCDEERAFRKAIWRDAFEFVRQEGVLDDEEENGQQQREDAALDDGELELPAPLPPVIIQNERYCTFVECVEDLERLSRIHVWTKYVLHLRRVCHDFFPERPAPEFEGEPLEDVFLDSSDEEQEVDDDSPARHDTLMMLRDEPDVEGRPKYKFEREDIAGEA